jgi:DNA polymerase-3 subunit beta
VLSGLLVASHGDRLSIAGYDQAIGLRVTLPATIASAGSVVAPGAALADLVGRLPAGCEVSVAAEGERLVVAAPGARYELPLAWDVDDWPALPDAGEQGTCEIPLGLLQGALERVAHCCAGENEGKGAAEGISLSGGLRLLASDGRRASLVELSGVDAAPVACVIPRALAREITRLPGDPESMAELTVTEGLVGVRVAGAAVAGNTISGDYPPVDRAFPAEHGAKITVAADLLAAAMDRLAVFSEVAVLEVDFDESALSISEENDSGKGVEQLSLELADGAGTLRLAVNPKYVLQALKAVNQDEVTIGLNGATGPAVIEAGFHRYLVMPISVAQK